VACRATRDESGPGSRPRRCAYNGGSDATNLSLAECSDSHVARLLPIRCRVVNTRPRLTDGKKSTRSSRSGRDHWAGGMTHPEVGTGPAVKTSNPCLPPRDAGCAVGGMRTWAEHPGRRASSLPTLLLSRPFVWAQIPSRRNATKERAREGLSTTPS
jgi:hypothetical protein